MEKHTQIGLKNNWSQTAARSRANRKASSAPLPFEVATYRRLLRRALRGKRSPVVLILGATTELRDLVISCGATSIAVDISADMLEQLTAVMRYRDDSRNLFIKGDWLKLGELLQPGSFDAVLADVSFNNVPPAKHRALFMTIARLLKSNGQFITRNFVYLPEKGDDTLAVIQHKYRTKRLNWLWLIIHVGQYSPWRGQIYSPKTKILKISRVFDFLLAALKRKTLSVSPEDFKKLLNVKQHAYHVNHISFPEKEWLAMVKRHFIVQGRISHRRYEWTQYAPIWNLKKRQ